MVLVTFFDFQNYYERALCILTYECILEIGSLVERSCLSLALLII